MDESTHAPAPSSVWLSLALNPCVTPKLIRLLRQAYPNVHDLASAVQQAVLNPRSSFASDPAPHKTQSTPEQLVEQLNNVVGRAVSSTTRHAIESALTWEANHPLNHLIGLDHPAYPALLQNTNNAPALLYVTGCLDCLNNPSVAIVGSRKATHAALDKAHAIATELSQAGITVISGLALGIDAAAHRGGLPGLGQTIAVAATGMDRVYPKRHAQLAAQIAEHGAIVTEFGLNSALRPHCFPRRNRIISGMSLGVLVVEAALPSGTLTTAQHALRQGREVMAIPGSVNNPLTRGCHELLRNGAALVESANDVIATLGIELKRHCNDKTLPNPPSDSKNLTFNDPDTITLLDCLGYDPVTIDTLVAYSGLPVTRVTRALTYLELSGVIVADHGGRYSRCKQTGKP